MKFFKLAIFLSLFLLLTACGKEKTGSGGDVEPSSSQKTAKGDLFEHLDQLTGTYFSTLNLDEVTSVTYSMFGEGGLSEYKTEDAELIAKTYAALSQISVKNETQSVADDYTEVIAFTGTNGNSYDISFNQKNLETEGKYYILENDSDFRNALTLIENTAMEAEADPDDDTKEDHTGQSDDKGIEGKDTDEVYSKYESDQMSFEYPKGWMRNDISGKVVVSPDGSELPPFISVEEIGWVESPGTFITNEISQFEKTYGNRMAQKAEMIEKEIGNDRKVAGFFNRYSSEDGSSTISRYELIEVIDDVSYLYVCEYVSTAYGDQHEDETTYFDYINAIQTMQVKVND